MLEKIQNEIEKEKIDKNLEFYKERKEVLKTLPRSRSKI